MNPDRVLRVPRGTLAAAVSPEPLDVVLDGLVKVGAVHGYELRGEEVLVWGDLAAMQAAIEQSGNQQEDLFDGPTRSTQVPMDLTSTSTGGNSHVFGHDPKHRASRRYSLSSVVLRNDGRREYYAACRAFMHDPRYRRLSATSKRIWALHAEGGSWQQIASRLKTTIGKVREVVRAARLLAGLPETVHSTARGGGTGCKTPFRKCAWHGCQLRGSWRGFCSRHYQQQKRET